jgi:TRAP-type C4-dicarboxylate transport system substrate-binding protein
MIRMLLLAGVLAIGGLYSPPAEAQNIALRYNNWVPPTYFMHARGLYKYFDEIKKVTEGRVTVEPSANALGPVPRNFQLAVDGIADVSWGIHGYTPGTFPLSEMVELPFGTKTAAINSVAYWRVYKKFFEPAQMHKGVHTLTVHVHPAGHIYTTKPVLKMEDFSGLKLRSTSAMVGESFKRLGAAPIGAPVTETREMLSRGLVDGLGFTDEAIYNFKINNYIKNVLRVPGGLYATSFFLVVNQAKWDSISEKDREAIMAISGEKLAQQLGQVWDDEDAGAVANVIKDGIKITELEGEFLEAFRKRLEGFDQDWIERANKAGVDGKGALAMFRELVDNN